MDAETWVRELDTWQHVNDEHVGQLRPDFEKRPDVTWHQVHHLLHRLFKWREWSHR